TASTVLALSKAAWKVGISLSDLDEDAEVIGPAIANLTKEVKSLGLECDQVYATVDDLIRKSEVGSRGRYEIDSRVWDCLETQVDEACRSVHELELFIKMVRGEKTKFFSQAQRLRQLDQIRENIAKTCTIVGKHTNSLRFTLLLINITLSHHAPDRSQHRILHALNKLQDMMNNLQRSSNKELDSRLSHTETILIQCAHEVVMAGSATYEAALGTDSIARIQSSLPNQSLATEWVNSLDSIRQDLRHLDQPNIASPTTYLPPHEGARSNLANTTSARSTLQKFETAHPKNDDSDDDLETDLARAALETGTEAFIARKWDEAESLLNETLRLLQQLTIQQRSFCNIFGLHYKLAICTYHTQQSAVAEEALLSLIQQSVSSDEERIWVYEAMHLLSQLYIRSGQIDRARTECEKVLQARRRLLGKRNDASLESLALMAHVYVLQENRALAKSCLAMIPDARRDFILGAVEASLGRTVEHLNFSSLLSPLAFERSLGSETETICSQSRLSYSGTEMGMEDFTHNAGFTTTNSPAASHWQSTPSVVSSPRQPVRSVTMVASSSTRNMSESMGMERMGLASENCPNLKEYAPEAAKTAEPLHHNGKPRSMALSRKEILEKVGCQPRDRVEEAVCAGDHSALVKLLEKKKSFWRLSFRKRARPERVTALHFAALFGEVEMAKRLLRSDFNINEVPFGYSTYLTPLHFAIGARQVNMVDFLIANGARPSKPDSWSSLAGQLMSRSWLIKTMSEAEKDAVPDRIIEIQSILLKHGWDLNVPIDASGKTVLHQAVSFWTGSYIWDMNLSATITPFLLEQGADPFRANGEGKTPYDIALASGHQSLMMAL
ncbi:hypothetical protein GQ44DRAFT_585056, partial [Phaeosphaeriaceae sp. PMI808]